jgi:hypothetical protein
LGTDREERDLLRRDLPSCDPLPSLLKSGAQGIRRHEKPQSEVAWALRAGTDLEGKEATDPRKNNTPTTTPSAHSSPPKFHSLGFPHAVYLCGRGRGGVLTPSDNIWHSVWNKGHSQDKTGGRSSIVLWTILDRNASSQIFRSP